MKFVRIKVTDLLDLQVKDPSERVALTLIYAGGILGGLWVIAWVVVQIAPTFAG